MSRRIGPITLEVAPAPAAGEGPSHSGTYRNIAAAEGLPDTFLGCATLYELQQERGAVRQQQVRADVTTAAWVSAVAAAAAAAAVAAAAAAAGNVPPRFRLASPPFSAWQVPGLAPGGRGRQRRPLPVHHIQRGAAARAPSGDGAQRRGLQAAGQDGRLCRWGAPAAASKQAAAAAAVFSPCLPCCLPWGRVC